MKIKKLIPSSLLGRSVIIVFVPTIAVVLLTAIVFYQTSWNIISKRLTQSVAGDINVVIKLIDQGLKFKAFRLANDDFKMKKSGGCKSVYHPAASPQQRAQGARDTAPDLHLPT